MLMTEAQKELFGAAEQLWQVQQTVNRWADEAGHRHLAIGVSDPAPNEAYGHAEVAMRAILQALLPAAIAQRVEELAVECGESLTWSLQRAEQEIEEEHLDTALMKLLDHLALEHGGPYELTGWKRAEQFAEAKARHDRDHESMRKDDAEDHPQAHGWDDV